MELDSYMSFIVRLWCDQAGDEWRGEVEHIQSGQRWSFGSLAQLLDFLQHAAEMPHVLVMRLTDEAT